MYRTEETIDSVSDMDVKIQHHHESPEFADMMSERAAAELAIDHEDEEMRAYMATLDLGSFAA
jgi:hypothetical protein